jgi:hypothetical protein
MSSSTERSSIQRIVWYWPWTVLALAIVPAIWHVLDFPSDINPEDPEVVRPTFSRALSHGGSPIADSCSRNSSGVSLRNSQKLKSGTFNPSRPYGV